MSIGHLLKVLEEHPWEVGSDISGRSNWDVPGTSEQEVSTWDSHIGCLGDILVCWRRTSSESPENQYLPSGIVLKKMKNYGEVRVKLTNNKIQNLESAAKNKAGTTLRITEKNFQDKELSH